MTLFIAREELTNRRIAGLEQDVERILLEPADAWQGELSLQEDIPEGEIWLYHPLVEQEGERISFEQLLLDERFSEGCLNIPRMAFERCGYCNGRMKDKQVYELLLRLAEQYPVIGKTVSENVCQTVVRCMDDRLESYRSDCYIAGKYSGVLREAGCFETVVEELLQRAGRFSDGEEAIRYLEEMLSHGSLYGKLEAETAPILIYYGATYCYNIMNTMLGQLAQALHRCGERVIIYEEQSEDVTGLGRLVGRRFKAVLGMQSYLLNIYMKESGRYFHDQIPAPKFNMILDHPVWLDSQLSNVPDNYYTLTHDENYCRFIRQYYPGVKASYLFPPGGMELQEVNLERPRTYGIVFVGTYGDYRKKCEAIRQSIPQVRFLANRFLLYMRKIPWLTAEKAFESVLEYYHIRVEQQDFFKMFYELRAVIQCVMYYYREKTVKTLLDAGIRVDIWGDSWKESPFAGHPNLTIHGEVTPEESLKVLGDAAVSLNIMAWHKGGFTERMASSMLAGAVLLTDATSYRDGELENGRQCVMFSLEKLKDLPGLARRLLEDTAWRKQIAQNGYRYAKKNHTWTKRAEQFLEILDEL